MTIDEAIEYFTNRNADIESAAMDEDKYHYGKKQIEDVRMRREFEANELAINALEEQKNITNEEIKQTTWVVGKDGAKVAFLDMPVDKAIQICEILASDMREPTEEERKSTTKYIDSISQSTGVKFDFSGAKTELEPCDDCVLANNMYPLKKQYIRFGHIPEDKISRRYRSGVVLSEEKGVSVWNCVFVNDVPFPVLPPHATECAMADYFYMLFGNRPVYLVEGTELPETGFVGEPLLGADIKIIKEYTDDYEYLKRIHRREEADGCEDCVSREAVEKITWEEPSYGDALNALTEVRDKVRALPSVTPQRAKGKWLDKKMTIKGAHGMTYGRYACSVCKKKFPNKSNYCPNCGAKMGGEDKDEN